MSVFARFFKPFTNENDTFQSCFILATQEIISYEYTKKWCGTGEFTMTLPLKQEFIRNILVNDIIYYNNDWLIITNTSYNNTQLTLSGTDLNGLLDTRITVFGNTQVAGADGYDVVKGSTGECVNHYVNNNLVNPTEEQRKIPKMTINKTAAGIQNDSYMARLQLLSEVVIDLCNNANIGYRVDGWLQGNKYRFNTLQGADRSVHQKDNPFVILSGKWGNVIDTVYSHSVENLYNAIYATGADVTQTIYRNDTVPKGFLRRETAVDVSVDTVADIKQYALYNVQDNIEVHNYDLDIKTVGMYGESFDLGDIITVKDEFTNNMFTAQVTEVKMSISSGQRKISITLGKQNQKLLNKIITGIYNGNLKKR